MALTLTRSDRGGVATLLRSLAAALMALTLGGCSLFGIRTAEETGYTLVQSDGDIELRDYDAFVAVETSVRGAFQDAGDDAFRKLFSYISGDNRARQKIDMTAPVIASQDAGNSSESIEMTAPVIAERDRDGWRYAFVLPARYRIDTAPVPTNPDLRLVEHQPRRVAVLTFSGTWRERAFEQNLERLNAWIDRNGFETASVPMFAGYDPPWAIPFLRRNEIIIDLKS